MEDCCWNSQLVVSNQKGRIVVADATVGLAAAIEALRTELSGAMLSGGGHGMLFQLEPIVLTLQTVVTDEGNGKVGWKILQIGASRESAVTQTLTLKLIPLWKRPDGTVVSQFAIASSVPAGERFAPPETKADNENDER